MSLKYAPMIDCCPIPKPLYPIAKKIKHDSGCTYQSIFRGTEARALLAKCGKHDQAYLYEHQGEPGIGPANPPGQSTHELRSDGVAYTGPVGRKLKWWQCGLDIDDLHVEAAIESARHHGWRLYRPYSSGSEYHHVNFAKRPRRWKAFFRHVFGVKAPKKPSHPRHISETGLNFIAHYEGFTPVAKHFDFDPPGVFTYGYGHTTNVTPGAHISRDQAQKLLRLDAQDAAIAVRDLVDVPLTQPQFDALVSFTYNVGPHNFATSTLLKKLNKRKYHAVPAQLNRWVYGASNQKLPGLIKRRKAEGKLFSGKR